jgi:hypothetical protein
LCFPANDVEFADERGREIRAAERRDFLDLGGAGDGHDAGHERHLHSVGREEVAELEVVPVVEKQLCDDEVGALLDLVLQVSPVGVLPVRAGHVSLRKTGDAD